MVKLSRIAQITELSHLELPVVKPDHLIVVIVRRHEEQRVSVVG